MEETLSVKNWSLTFISNDVNIDPILTVMFTQNISLDSHFQGFFS